MARLPALLLFSQLVVAVDALVAHSNARVPIELGGTVYIGPSRSEAAFTAELAARGCVVGRYRSDSIDLC